MKGSLKLGKEPATRFLEDLNAMGRQGWEAVGFQGDTLVGTVLLRRQLPDD